MDRPPNQNDATDGGMLGKPSAKQSGLNLIPMFPRQQQTASTTSKSENDHRNSGKTTTNLKPRKLPSRPLEQKQPVCLPVAFGNKPANKPSRNTAQNRITSKTKQHAGNKKTETNQETAKPLKRINAIRN
jgi:hypothetical protein